MVEKAFQKTILPTACFPNAAYLYYIQNSDKIFIELHETYPKQTWRNRYSIMTSNGVLDLTVPVKKPNGNYTKTAEVIIDYNQKWQINHWRAIESAYKKSPFFLYYEELVGQFFNSRIIDTLADWNLNILSSIAKEFDLNNEFSFTESYIHFYDDANDLRQKISPKVKECENIMIFPEYTQVFMDKQAFKPNLSVIDLIFNLGPELKDYISSIQEFRK